MSSADGLWIMGKENAVEAVVTYFKPAKTLPFEFQPTAQERAFKFIVLLRAYTNVRCTEAGSTGWIKAPYCAPRPAFAT